MRTLKTLIRLALAGTVVIAIALPVRAEKPTVTFESLLDEMVDRDAAARFPQPAYTCRQASSYDRASVSAENQETWMANNDRSFFIREEENDGRVESVMMDAPGPGCVVRFWATSGNPIGNIRVYVDGNKEPVINLPAKGLVGGDALVGPPLSEVRARGMNLYLPIPYAKHCKITYDRPNFQVSKNRDDLLYYQINYRTYEPAAKVESFSRKGFEAAKPAIARLQESLLDPAAGLPADGRTSTPDKLQPGKSTLLDGLIRTDQPHAVRVLAVKLEAEDLVAATRSTVLSIDFDEQKAVWCPVGDFFGSGVGVNAFKGWWRSVDDDGWMTCYWVMPFKKTCFVKFHNFGEQDVQVSCKTITRPWQWDDRTMYFHADWRQEYPIDSSVHHDWNYVETAGKGVYMGDTLCVYNPVEGWWGEGDEKIYVDGEEFPSHFGTGTEDYYGYAWCTPEFFCSPFHSQPLAEGPRNAGNVTNTRVRLLDGIPFTKSVKMDMEIWHWRPCTVAYAATTYWYGLPGATSNRGPAPEMARVFRPEAPKPPKVEGALEGEELKIVEKTGEGKTMLQSGASYKWSGHKQIWWIDGKPGDKLVLALPVKKAGKYALAANLTKAIDYGIVQLSLDGKPLGEPIDLINDGVVTRLYKLGTHQLAAGESKLTVEITGANPEAVKRHMFGLDYLKLDPAD